MGKPTPKPRNMSHESLAEYLEDRRISLVGYNTDECCRAFLKEKMDLYALYKDVTKRSDIWLFAKLLSTCLPLLRLALYNGINPNEVKTAGGWSVYKFAWREYEDLVSMIDSQFSEFLRGPKFIRYGLSIFRPQLEKYEWLRLKDLRKIVHLLQKYEH